jgi:hypothetical protein
MKDADGGVEAEAPLYLSTVRHAPAAACLRRPPAAALPSPPPPHMTANRCRRSPCAQPQVPGEKEKEVNDCKTIVQNMVYGMKTLLFSILYCTRMVGAAGVGRWGMGRWGGGWGCGGASYLVWGGG